MASVPDALSRVDHLVVLMFENRSFDNLLGWLYEHDSPDHFLGRGEPVYRGLADGEHWNPDEGDPPREIAARKAPWRTEADMTMPAPDPGEEYSPHVNRQIYGVADVSTDIRELPDPAPMNGFLRDYLDVLRKHRPDAGVERARTVLDGFPPEAVPVTSGLARSFAVSDEWFSAVPSQTLCNRSFFHSAQSRGNVTNLHLNWLDNTAPTVFERLSEKLPEGRDWRVYWDPRDVLPATRVIHPRLMAHRWHSRFVDRDRFEADCRAGDLPAYTFVQPRLYLHSDDMHPPVTPWDRRTSSILGGERLLAEVYDAVRNGAAWERTLLLVTFDEHGGCYDHVPPPLGATPPWKDPPHRLEGGFRFDRYGVRVPAIFVSPFVEPGTVVRARRDAPFSHASLIRTLCLRWGLEPLTDRDRGAPDFAHVLTRPSDRPRRLTPSFQPRDHVLPLEEEGHDHVLSGFQKEVARLMGHHLGKPVERELESVGDFLRHFGRA